MSQIDDESAFDLQPAELQTLRSLVHSDPPHGQRAQALLSLSQGADLAGAAVQSGLTENQVRHWRGRFRSQGLSIFPDDLLSAHTAVPALPRQESPGLLSAPPAAPMLQSPPAKEALSAGSGANATPKSGKKKKDVSKEKSGKDKKKKDNKGKKGNKGNKGKGKKKKGKKGEKSGKNKSKKKKK